jgi:predicted Holliday junction resolvase-like endonuclease
MNVARLGNKYLADEEPWKMVKINPERVQTQMYVALQIASALAVLSEPFLPFTAKKLSNILKIDALGWNDVTTKTDLLPAGHQIGQAEILFAQIEDAEIQKQLDKLEATKTANQVENAKAEPQKEIITFEDFAKVDLRIGTIIEAEKMPKANKLLVLKVDTGIDVRTIVSGIAEHFTPEAMELLKEKKDFSKERKLELKDRAQKKSQKIETTTQSVNIGFILERLAPSLQGFRFDKNDCRSLFDPIDYVIFEGLNKTGSVQRIIFTDIKTGDARLKKSQKQIRQVVDERKVEFRTYNQ